MKKVLSKLITAMTVVIVSACLTPAFGDGMGETVKCAPKKHRKHLPKRHHNHHQPREVLPEPCPVEPACPTAIPPCNDLYYSPCQFYAGGQIGYMNMRGKFHVYQDDSRVLDSAMKTDNGFMGEILGGYRYFWSSGVNLGAELSASLDSTDLKRPLSPINQFSQRYLVNVKFRRTFAITPAITVGRVFQCRWNFFAKLGLGISRFETKLNVPGTNVGGKTHKTKLGVVPSMGMEYAINNCLSALETITYEYYDKVGTTFQNVPTNGTHVRLTPRRIQYVAAKAGFIAKF
jgi:hypothetical protein